jgi:hypothetical protein
MWEEEVPKRSIVYHGGCPDGEAAAFLAGSQHDEYIPYTHGVTTLDIKHFQDKEVLFLDVCPPSVPDIKKVAKSVFVVDHHVSSSSVCAQLDKSEYHLDTKQVLSGAGLVWTVLLKKEQKDMPKWLRVVNDFDTGPHKLNEQDEAFHAGVCEIGNFAAVEVMSERTLQQVGNATMEKRKARVQEILPSSEESVLFSLDKDKKLIESTDFLKAWFEKTKTKELRVAYATLDSESLLKLLYQALLKKHPSVHLVAMRRHKAGGNMAFSLRRPDESFLDLNLLAKLYGCGGHPAAAAVQSSCFVQYLNSVKLLG